MTRPASAMQLRRSEKVSAQPGKVASGESQRQVRAKLDSKCRTPQFTLAGRWRIERSHPTSVQTARPAGWRAAHLRGGSDERKLDNTLLMITFVRHTIRQREEECKIQTHRVRSHSSRFQRCHAVTPNPFIERTRSGSAGLASISFWAKPALPPRAAHVKR